MEQFNKTENLVSAREPIAYESGPQSNQTVDNIKDKVAQGLKSAAGSLKQRRQQDGVVSAYANQLSGWLDSASDYVRDVNVSQVKNDIQRQVRTNPGRTLLIAGAAGLVLGALFRRR
ncbi:MAG TPA: hypothetical protein VNS63_03570 [Blastocatellia bacterium]|nr:hypothetical protein [Blastocatellia bacterium]